MSNARAVDITATARRFGVKSIEIITTQLKTVKFTKKKVAPMSTGFYVIWRRAIYWKNTDRRANEANRNG